LKNNQFGGAPFFFLFSLFFFFKKRWGLWFLNPVFLNKNTPLTCQFFRSPFFYLFFTKDWFFFDCGLPLVHHPRGHPEIFWGGPFFFFLSKLFFFGGLPLFFLVSFSNLFFLFFGRSNQFVFLGVTFSRLGGHWVRLCWTFFSPPPQKQKVFFLGLNLGVLVAHPFPLPLFENHLFEGGFLCGFSLSPQFAGFVHFFFIPTPPPFFLGGWVFSPHVVFFFLLQVFEKTAQLVFLVFGQRVWPPPRYFFGWTLFFFPPPQHNPNCPIFFFILVGFSVS